MIALGDAEASVLIQRVTEKDESERMPPIGEPLQSDQIATLRSWMLRKQRAGGREARSDPRDHWAFRSDCPTAGAEGCERKMGPESH